MDESTLTLTKELAEQFPALAIFAGVLGLIVRAFLAHLKLTAAANLAHLKAADETHKEAMVEVVTLTTEALAKNTEAIFEQSRLVGATLQALKAQL